MAAAGAGDRGGRDARVSRDAVPRARAPRVAAPGAQRITLTGVMAVPDDFGRLRLLLLDERPDGAPDGSWGRLRNAVPRLHAGYRPLMKCVRASLARMQITSVVQCGSCCRPTGGPTG